jgi:hypothetical protein
MSTCVPNPYNLPLALETNSEGAHFLRAQLRHVNKGTEFRRKLDAKATFIRNHYNRKDSFGPASFSCTDSEDICREIFLKPETWVFVEVAS